MGDFLSSISILLVFLSVLFNFIQGNVNATLKKLTPDVEKITDRETRRIELRWTLLKSFLITLAFGLVFYILLPKTLEIISISKFVIWGFDALATILTFIELGLGGFTIYGIIQTSRVIGKLWNCRKGLESKSQ